MLEIHFPTFYEGWQEDQATLLTATSREEQAAMVMNIENSALWFRTHFNEYLDSAIEAKCLKDFELLLRVYPELDAEGYAGDLDYFSDEEEEENVGTRGYIDELFSVSDEIDYFEGPWYEKDYLLQ